MAQNFYDFRQDIIDWSNRDSGVLTPAVLRDCMNFAADTCYRELEVPPLEATVTYQLTTNGFQPRYGITQANLDEGDRLISMLNGTALTEDTITINGETLTPLQIGDTGPFYIGLQIPPITPVSAYVRVENEQAQVRVSRLPIPTDATSFIHLRTITSNGVEYVINEKVDTRTFWDTDSIKTSNTYWSRQGNTILVGGFDVDAGTVLELHYYRRLPAVDARYAITPANFTGNRLTLATTITSGDISQTVTATSLGLTVNTVPADMITVTAFGTRSYGNKCSYCCGWCYGSYWIYSYLVLRSRSP